MKNRPEKVLLLVFISLILGCVQDKKELPYLGETITENGITKHHTVDLFSHYNQDSVEINNEKMSSYIYIADFFFTSCPSICPKVMKEMTKIYDAVKNEDDIKLITFTIDPKRDNVAKLKLYSNNLNIDHSKWFFLTGDKDKTLELANSFFVVALEDESAPGGFDHSGKIILVDKSGHVRSFSEGTDPESTPGLIKDIFKLKESYKNQ